MKENQVKTQKESLKELKRLKMKLKNFKQN